MTPPTKNKETQLTFACGCDTERLKCISKRKKSKTHTPPRRVASAAINYPRLTFQKVVIEIFSCKHTTREREVSDIPKTKATLEGSEQRHPVPALAPRVQPPAAKVPKESRSAGATFRLTQRNATRPEMQLFFFYPIILSSSSYSNRNSSMRCLLLIRVGWLGGRNEGNTASRKNLCATRRASYSLPCHRPDKKHRRSL